MHYSVKPRNVSLIKGKRPLKYPYTHLIGEMFHLYKFNLMTF